MILIVGALLMVALLVGQAPGQPLPPIIILTSLVHLGGTLSQV